MRNTSIVSMQLTSKSDIFVGCADGSVFLYDVKGNRTPMNSDCSQSAEHGELVKAYYFSEALLMVVVYKSGAVHLRKCTQSITSSLTWRTSCISLRDAERSVCDVDCLFFPGGHELETRDNSPQYQQQQQEDSGLRRLEVWFGVDSDAVEVWSLSLSPDQVWMSDTMSQIRTVSSVRIADACVVGGECEVCLVRGSSDRSMVGAVIQTPRGGGVIVGLFSVQSKQYLRSVQFGFSGA